MAAKLPHCKISKHTKRNEFIMKKKLLSTKTSKRNAKRTRAHSVSLSRWLGGKQKETILKFANGVWSLKKTNFCGIK
jgi:hypothetical protein